jgi:hypothetical protein
VRPDRRDATSCSARVTNPARPSWPLVAGAAIVSLAVILLLALTLRELSISRDNIQTQRAIAAAARDDARPVLESTRPLLADAPGLLRDARRLAGPLAETGLDLRAGAERVPALAAAAQSLAGNGNALLEQLTPADLAGTAAAIRWLVIELASDDRLESVLDGSRKALEQLHSTDLLARLSRTPGKLREVIALQRDTVHVLRRSYNVQRDSLSIQKETLRHVRAIDERTGGALTSP